MSPVSTMQELPPPLDVKESTMEHTSSYSSLMNGFGLWSSSPNDDLKKNSGSEVGTADADEEEGEEYVYEEPVVTEVAEDGTNLKKKKKMGSFLKKLKTRASIAKQERQEKRIQKLEEKHLTANSKSCLPTLTLPTRRAHPVQITVLEGDNDHHDYEIDDLDEEEQAQQSKVKAQGQKIINLEWLTDQRIKDALAHDETESICSLDGVPTLPPLEEDAKTSNKKKKQLAALAFANKNHKRDITKIQPQFVQATKGQSALDAVRREVDAIMLEQMAAEAAPKSRGAPAPVEEPEVAEATAPSTPQKGWSLFSSSKSKQEPKEAQEQQVDESFEDDQDLEDAPATPDSKGEPASPSKKSSGWSMFSWKSKDGNDEKRADDDDGSEDEDCDDESYNGSEGSFDDEYTRGTPSMVTDDQSRATKITVVNTKQSK